MDCHFVELVFRAEFGDEFAQSMEEERRAWRETFAIFEFDGKVVAEQIERRANVDLRQREIPLHAGERLPKIRVERRGNRQEEGVCLEGVEGEIFDNLAERDGGIFGIGRLIDGVDLGAISGDSGGGIGGDFGAEFYEGFEAFFEVLGSVHGKPS